ncbi:hypothetical protein P170DRAFT_456319 [Aspergillus steynii IBT 23096]|uniref:Phosphatidylglycerol lysyltransferase C-terminal domain-containing protein n=1 Tax=Aspergillus steynii IBT 23096 TaxID=1392250 RepID=A0A2I2GAC0_9EURO|nr:uncharacterized protein P170DRAFT_456319 [Aspergillus steynii IBT 23096]PLB49825.1 hypothetical protein P170DRAFT_456319 [Aspergillus steynii IBT 23096]
MAVPPCEDKRPVKPAKGRTKQPKQHRTTKKALLLDSVGPQLLKTLNSYPKPDTYNHNCGSPPTDSSFFLQPRPSRLSRSASSDNGRSDNTTFEHTPKQSKYPILRERRSLPFLKRKPQPSRRIQDYNPDANTRRIIEYLAARYGTVSHMGMLDRSYRFFLNKAHTAALCYKILNHVAIVSGDPLCESSQIDNILDEFTSYRKKHSLDLAFMGASESFAKYARQRNWNTMQFGVERVLNPRTNDVLLERSSKRVIVQNRQLLNPQKGGITLGVYVPASGEDARFQSELIATTSQAFITVYNPFDFPKLMTFIYTRASDGTVNGFAALRRIGTNNGYHIDPCIAAPGAPKGISDLLTYAAMALLHHGDISYLSLGYEPLPELGEVTGMSSTLERLTRSLYHHTYQRLPIHGKKAYHDKLRPDACQESGLYVIFPAGMPGVRQMVAMAHMANISIRKLVRTKGDSPPVDSARQSEKLVNGGEQRRG